MIAFHLYFDSISVLFLAHQNGAANFYREPVQHKTHSSTHAQGRPPSAALPKLSSQRVPRTPAHNQSNQTNQRNLDFLNVPDQGMSG